jgi:signal transduction histidine kinase
MPEVLVDRERLAQALTNIVANAFRFTPDGGEVAVSATARADALEIAVRDTGIGIAPAEFDRVFERIYEGGNVYHHSSGTTEFGSSGLGLGLPIAKGIVEAHGGRICLESVPGQGSVFTITLPWERIRAHGGASSTDAWQRPSEHANDADRGGQGIFEEVHP